MKKKNLKLWGLSSSVLLLLLVLLAGTALGQQESSGTTDNKKTIKIATMGLNRDVVMAAKKEFDKSGYILEVKTYDDWISPNVAVDEGSMDANFFQHVPYLNQFNKERKGSLIPYGKKMYTNIFGIFSEKITRLEDLRDGAQVATNSDASNRHRALVFLESLGLIKLKEGIQFATKADIVENKKNLKLIEMEGFKLPAVLQDVDVTIGNTAVMALAGKYPEKLLVIESLPKELYANVIVVKDGRKDLEWAKELEDALTSESVVNFVQERYKGAFAPAWR